MTSDVALTGSVDDLPEDFFNVPQPPARGSVDSLPSDFFSAEPDQNEVVYRGDTQTPLLVPAGLQADEISYLDDVQNNGRNENDYFGFLEVGAQSVFNFGRGAASQAIRIPNILTSTALRERADIRADVFRDDRTLDEKLADPDVAPEEKLQLINEANTPAFFQLLTRAGQDRAAARVEKIFADDDDIAEEIAESERLIEASRLSRERNQQFIRDAGLEGEGLAFDLGSGFTTVLGSIGLMYATKSAIPSAALFGEIQRSSIYQEAIEETDSVRRSQAVSRTAGLFEAGVEAIGLNIFRRIAEASTPIRRIVFRSLEESFQEGIQTAGEEVITNKAGIRDTPLDEAASDVGYSMLIGLILSGGVSTTMEIGRAVAKSNGVDISEEQLEQMATFLEENQVTIQEEIARNIEAEATKQANPRVAKKVSDLLTKFRTGEVIDIEAEIRSESGIPDSVKDELVAQIQQEDQAIRDQIDETVRVGRVSALDTQITNLDTSIAGLEDQILEAQDAGRPTRALANRLERLLGQREELDTERVGLLPDPTLEEQRIIDLENRQAQQIDVSPEVREYVDLAEGIIADQQIDEVDQLFEFIEATTEQALPPQVQEFLSERYGLPQNEDVDSEAFDNAFEQFFFDVESGAFDVVDDQLGLFVDSEITSERELSTEELLQRAVHPQTGQTFEQALEANQAAPDTDTLEDYNGPERQAFRDGIARILSEGAKLRTGAEYNQFADELAELQGFASNGESYRGSLIAGLTRQAEAAGIVFNPATNEYEGDSTLPPVEQGQTLEIVLGPPGAGKSTSIVNDLKGKGFLEIDADLAKEIIPEFENGIGSGAVHEESSQIIEQPGGVLETALLNGDNIALPMVGKNLNKIRDIIDNAKKIGYNVNVRLVDVPPAVSLNRTIERFARTGRLVPPDVVSSVGRLPKQTFDAVKNLEEVDLYAEFNTDGQTQVLESNDPAYPAESLRQDGERSGGGNATNSGRKTVAIRAKQLERLGIKFTEQRVRGVQKGFREGQRLARRETKAAQEQIIKTIEQSGLTPNDRAKFIRAIKNIQTAEQAAKQFPIINSRISRLIDAQQRRELKSVIGKMLKRTKMRKQGGKKVGRFTPETQEILDRLRELNKLGVQESADVLQANFADGSVPSAEQRLENMILSMNANQGISVSEIADLALNIDDIIQTGKQGAELRALHKDRQVERSINKLRDLIGEPVVNEQEGFVGRFARNLKRNLGNGFNGWSGQFETKLRTLFQSRDGDAVNDFIDNEASLFDETRKYEQGKIDQTIKIKKALRKVTGLTERQLVNKMMRDESEVIDMGTFTFADGIRRRLNGAGTDGMTRAELRKRWMELQDPQLRESMMSEKGNAYTEDIVAAIEQELTPQDIAIAQAQLDFYNSYYNRINEVYRRIYGVNLPKVEFYSPIRREVASEETDPFLNGILYMGGVAPGSLKSRTPNVRPIRAVGDFNALLSHIQEMEYFIAYSEKVGVMTRAFRNPEIQKLIKDVGGKEALQLINRDIDYFSRRGRELSTVGDDTFRTLVRNFGFAQLAAKPQIGLKQLTSFPAMASGVKSRDFIEGLGVLAANPRKALRTMKRSQFWSQRGVNLDRDLNDVIRDKNALNIMGKNPTVANILMMPIQFGDKGAIFIGGFAHYHAKRKQLIAQGKSVAEAEAAAIRSFEMLANRTQQSTDPDQLSELQRSNNVFSRILSQFMSSPNALARAEYRAVLEFAKGRLTPQEFAKQFFIFHFVIPNLFQLMANGLAWDNEDQLRASLLGTLNGWFVWGYLLESSISAAITGDFFEPEIRHPLDFMTPFLRAMKDIAENGIDYDDFFENSKQIENLLEATSSVSGIPFKTLYTEMRGLKQVVTADDEDDVVGGGALMLGYSPYIVDKKILGDDD